MSRILCAALASIVSASALAPTAAAETVRDWRNSMHYPARVLAVDWPHGRLDANSSVRFGAWTLRFGTPTKFAVQAGAFIMIINDTPDLKAPRGYNTLRCANAAIGDAYCGLFFDVSTGVCQLQIYGHLTRDTRHVDIPCPNSLDLAQ